MLVRAGSWVLGTSVQTVRLIQWATIWYVIRATLALFTMSSCLDVPDTVLCL